MGIEWEKELPWRNLASAWAAPQPPGVSPWLRAVPLPWSMWYRGCVAKCPSRSSQRDVPHSPRGWTPALRDPPLPPPPPGPAVRAPASWRWGAAHRVPSLWSGPSLVVAVGPRNAICDCCWHYSWSSCSGNTTRTRGSVSYYLYIYWPWPLHMRGWVPYSCTDPLRLTPAWSKFNPGLWRHSQTKLHR